MVYDVITSVSPQHLDLDLPLEVEIGESIWASLTEDQGTLRLLVRRRVDNQRLELTKDSGWHRKLPDGTEEAIWSVRIQDDDAPEHVLVRDLMSALAFFTDARLSLIQSAGHDRFLPENDDDQNVLARLGSDLRYSAGSARPSIRTFSAPVTSGNIMAVMTPQPRRIGLRIYADALKSGFDASQFRELWRVLESAFQASEAKLVALLSDYRPAQKLGFDKSELEALRILRGQASHAVSKAGLKELVRVERECAEKLPRLKSLVERVILTKKDWGYPTTGVEELTPVQAYVGKDGGVKLIRRLPS
jgi:hypothetical protein